jgi:anti-anti-sigma factor
MNGLEATHRPLAAVEIEIHEHVGTAIVTLRGEHDLSTRAFVSEALAQVSEYARVLVDLSECTFADSCLVGALFVAHAAISERDGRLEVIIPPEATAARRLAELARLAFSVPIHATLRPAGRKAGA